MSKKLLLVDLKKVAIFSNGNVLSLGFPANFFRITKYNDTVLIQGKGSKVCIPENCIQNTICLNDKEPAIRSFPRKYDFWLNGNIPVTSKIKEISIFNSDLEIGTNYFPEVDTFNIYNSLVKIISEKDKSLYMNLTSSEAVLFSNHDISHISSNLKDLSILTFQRIHPSANIYDCFSKIEKIN